MKTKHVAVWSLEKDESFHFKIWVVEMVVLFTRLQWKIAQNSQDLTFVPWLLEKWWWFEVCLPFWFFSKVYRHFGATKVHGLKCANAGFFPGEKLVYDVHLSNIERARLLGIPYNQCKLSILVPVPKPVSLTRRNRGNGYRMPVEKPIGEAWWG